MKRDVGRSGRIGADEGVMNLGVGRGRVQRAVLVGRRIV